MKRKLKLPSAIAVLSLSAAATIVVHAKDSTNLVSSARMNHPFTVGAELGTTGVGGEANWRLLDHFGVRAGFDYLSYSLNNKSFQDATYNANLRLQSEPLALDLYPSKSSSFHVSLGMLFNQNQVTGNSENATVGTYTGKLNLSIKPQPVDPYLAIGGNLYFDKRQHFSLSGTLGAAYTGNYQVRLTSIPPDITGSVAGQQAKIANDLNKVKFWPILKIGLNYSF